MRLDVYLTEKGFYKSRTRALRAIREGLVSVAGNTVRKPAFEVTPELEAKVSAGDDPVKFVSRGGLKLEFALERFGLSAEGRRCIDIGASSGGFTQVLLENGAKSVDAVDVGHGQLAPELTADPRVRNIENCDVRQFVPEHKYDFLTMDVSFISINLLAGTLHSFLLPGANAVVLFKPQFEVGRANIGKGGVVRSQKLALEYLENTVDLYENCGFKLRGMARSPVAGGDGNTEYLLWFTVLPENIS